MIRFMRCHILFCEKTDVSSLPEVDDVSLSHCITLFHRRGEEKKTWLQTFLKTNGAVVAVS